MELSSNSSQGPILVSHVGRRDSYELAYALSLSGRPVHLVTDFYYQPGTIIGRLAQALFGPSVHKRHRPDLQVTVHSSVLLFALDLVERVLPRNKTVNRLRGYALGRNCLGVIKRHSIKDAYLYYNSGTHCLGRKNAPLRVTLFQMHPHAKALVRIYRRYSKVRPALAKALSSQEEELTNNLDYLDLLAGEALLADRVLCTSHFVRQTLLEAGIPADRIVVVPYGTPDRSLKAEDDFSRLNVPSEMIRLAFVGQFVVRKGVYELMSFAVAHPEAEVIVFSREADEAQALTKGWFGKIPSNLTFRCIVDDYLLWQEVLTCDFLVLPSLAEGYGLVLSEAMSQGLPVIATRNSAAPDLVVDGENGFLMDDIFEQDIAQAVKRALAKKNDWPRLRRAALATAAPYGWDRFRKGILSLLPADEK